MKKRLIYLLVLVIVVVGGYFFFNKKPTVVEEGKVIKIGAILPLTGPAPAFGESGKNSIELALSSLSPETRAKIQVIYEDDQLDTKRTVAAVHKLIGVDKADILLTFSSASSVAASYVAEQEQVPLIGVGTAKEISESKQWVVKPLPNPEDEIAGLERLVLRNKYKKVAIIWNQADGPKAVHDAALEILPALGYEIVADESVAKTDNDFRTVIAKVRAKNPDVLIGGVFPQMGILAKQIKDVRWDVPLAGFINFEAEDQIRISDGRLENQIYVGHDSFDFVDRYYQIYNRYPAVAADLIHDSIIQVARAIEAGKTSKEEILDFFKQDFLGPASGQFKYLGGGNFDVELIAKIYKDGKFRRVK